MKRGNRETEGKTRNDRKLKISFKLLVLSHSHPHCTHVMSESSMYMHTVPALRIKQE
jgi:hypothetical protein